MKYLLKSEKHVKPPVISLKRETDCVAINGIHILADDVMIAFLNEKGQLEMNTYAANNMVLEKLKFLGFDIDMNKKAVKVVW